MSRAAWGTVGRMADPARPSVIVFDVNETLSDLSPLGARFVEVGASASAAPLWFASVLRDGFALSMVGENPRFADVSRALLRDHLGQARLNRPVGDAVEHVMDGFARLELHPDVAPALRRLGEDGFRLVTLSNGSASVAERLLGEADLRHHVEHVLSVEDAGAWKPDPRALRVCRPGLRRRPRGDADGRGAPLGRARGGPGRAAARHG